jgi:uracil-DNA glycosylase family 4
MTSPLQDSPSAPGDEAEVSPAELLRLIMDLRARVVADAELGLDARPAAPKDAHRVELPGATPGQGRGAPARGGAPRPAAPSPRPAPVTPPVAAPTAPAAASAPPAPAGGLFRAEEKGGWSRFAQRPAEAAPTPAPSPPPGPLFSPDGAAFTPAPRPSPPWRSHPSPHAMVTGAWGFSLGGPDVPINSRAEAAAVELRAVRESIGDCARCRLCEQRNHIVFGMGNPDADLVIVGEGPGANEDAQGLPFVGASGEMLDRMLSNVLSLSRDEVYILNVVKCRPPNNRTPEPEEIAACRPFLDRQLAALRPKVLLAMGRPAAQTLLGTTQGINALRGTWKIWDGRVPLMSTYHPAYLLRRPEDKVKTFEDLKLVRRRYDELGGRRRA